MLWPDERIPSGSGKYSERARLFRHVARAIPSFDASQTLADRQVQIRTYDGSAPAAPLATVQELRALLTDF